MTPRSGGEESGDGHLAPVIPLFGGADRHGRSRAVDDAGPRRAHPAGSDVHGAPPQDSDRGGATEFEPDAPSARSSQPEEPSALRVLGRRIADPVAAPSDDASDEPDPAEVRRDAEEALVRKLRGRALSVSEARAVLREHRLPRDEIEDVIDDFSRRGYIDDRTLATLLVTSGVERKKQGRVALARTLAQRGIPREIVDETLSELPDDDAERALEFARSKVGAMSRLDPEVAKRRLAGQLARRGFPGDVVSSTVRTVIAEQFSTRRGSGIRFE